MRMKPVSPRTVEEFRLAVKDAGKVFGEVRFGPFNIWVRVSKVNALSMVEDCDPDEAAIEFGFVKDKFGHWEGDDLVLACE